MLPPACPMVVVTSPRAPGWSGISTWSRVRRPERTSPRMMTEASSRGSMLPPLSTTPTSRPARRAGCSRSAAMPAAPAPSTTTFSISRRRFMASSTVVSSTVTISSTSSLISSAGDGPGDGDRDPLRDRRPAYRQVATRDRGEHRRPAVALHPDDGHVGALGAGDHGHAGEQTAAPGRHHQRVELGMVGEQLERHRALAGDDRPGRRRGARTCGPRRPAGAPPRWPRRGRRRAAPRGRRGPRCAAPSRTACGPASRWWPRCRAGWRGGPQPGRGCRPTWPPRRSDARPR